MGGFFLPLWRNVDAPVREAGVLRKTVKARYLQGVHLEAGAEVYLEASASAPARGNETTKSCGGFERVLKL